MPQIHIESPCKEKWNKMLPHQEGRFCLSCSTPVIDFTDKSEKEILDYFEKRKDEHFCGKYRAEHVSTPRSIRFKWVLIALTLIFGAGFISSCRRRAVGKFTLRIDKAKTEISNTNSHGTNPH
ncbi:MAG TPA: hypothetical protein VFJ43_15165 [Bacteroidia bacterium]|nr:hypothetical protein [Bacteroidia bacterium]